MFVIVTLTVLHGVSCLMPLQIKVNQTNYTPWSYHLVCVPEDSVLAKTLKVGRGKPVPLRKKQNEYQK